MECLSCGDCCARMSPFGENPCPHLTKSNDIFTCDIYELRPDACIQHSFPSRFCPVGVSVLGIETREAITARIDLINDNRRDYGKAKKILARRNR